jgi:hypothetical protein
MLVLIILLLAYATWDNYQITQIPEIADTGAYYKLYGSAAALGVSLIVLTVKLARGTLWWKRLQSALPRQPLPTKRPRPPRKPGRRQRR